MRKFAVVVALFAMSAPANAVFFTYSQWEALAPIERASYISGLYDGLVSFASDADDARVGSHYQSCITRSKMTNVQLSDNVRTFASTRPKLQISGVGGALRCRQEVGRN
jgi:hypothetical protein